MFLLLLYSIAQFSTQYEDFASSPSSDSVFMNLASGDHKISDYANNPIVLWFWRSNSGSTEADSLLKKNYLRRNFYISAVLRWEAKESDGYEKKVNKLHLAAHFDSSAIENFLSIVALGLGHRDISQIKTALSLPVLSDFRSQLFIITNLVILLTAVVFMWGVVYILVKIVYYLPSLSHHLWPRKHVHNIDIIKSVILLIPILVLRNLYLIVICYAIILTLILNKREKNWLRLNFIVLLLMFILSFPINNFIRFLKTYNHEYQIYELVNYDSSCSLEADNDTEKELLAYGLKQQGRLEAAQSSYEDLFYRGLRNVTVINNLANIYSAYDAAAQAESLYNLAILVEDRGEPYLNLGLLKLKNIEYSESSKYMEEARIRGVSSTDKEPVDIKPKNSDFYGMVFAQKLQPNGIIKIILVLPIIVILILTFLPVKLSPPFSCTSCGRPICKDCLCQVDEETICEDCFTKFKLTKKKELEEDLKRAVGRTRKKIRKVILYAVNIIVPGAGLIYIKKNLAGIIIVSLVMASYVPLLFPGIFVKPAGWVVLPLSSIFLFIAAPTAILSYVISFLLIREHHAD